MPKRITTWMGDIAPEELGICSMHDHTLADMTALAEQYRAFTSGQQPKKEEILPENFAIYRTRGSLPLSALGEVNTVAHYADEIGFFAAQGGGTVLDCSPIGMRPTEKVLELAKAVKEKHNVNLIGATGLYTAQSRPSVYKTISEEEQLALFRKEVTVGMGTTTAKPGFLKCAVSELKEDKSDICDIEYATVRACAQVASESGLMIGIHTPHHIPEAMVLNMVDRILGYGVNPDKVVLFHQDSNAIPTAMYVKNPNIRREINADRVLHFLETGINVSLDTWGFPITIAQMMMPDDYDRLRLLHALLDAGYEDRIVVGHDFSTTLMSRKFGNFGYTRILNLLPDALKMLGYESASEKILRRNPARILAY